MMTGGLFAPNRLAVLSVKRESLVAIGLVAKDWQTFNRSFHYREYPEEFNYKRHQLHRLRGAAISANTGNVGESIFNRKRAVKPLASVAPSRRTRQLADPPAPCEKTD